MYNDAVYLELDGPPNVLPQEFPLRLVSYDCYIVSLRLPDPDFAGDFYPCFGLHIGQG